MIKKLNSVGKIILFFTLILLIYVSLPSPGYPEPPPDSIQSLEGGDTETPLRRAYFTDFTRQEVLDHYQKQFAKSRLFDIPLITYRLNYPPEEAQTLIRDQTRSTYLEEITQPLRESFFVNGFEPIYAKDDIWYRGQNFKRKITVRYVPSNVLIRIVVVLFIGMVSIVVINVWSEVIKTFPLFKKLNKK